jgi:hypothetical protein
LRRAIRDANPVLGVAPNVMVNRRYLDGGSNLAFGIDLKLGPWASNGRPTKTNPPLRFRPVLAAGKTTGYASDQRGYLQQRHE